MNEPTRATLDPHPNLGKALLIGAVASIVLTSITCGLHIGIALGAVGAIPVALVTCCLSDKVRLRAAIFGAIIWAVVTGAIYNYFANLLFNAG